MKRLLPVLLLLAPLMAAAADEGDTIYRSVDEDGNVVYTDKPPSDDAEPVNLDPVTTIPAYRDDNTSPDSRGDGGEQSAPAYDGLAITYPTPDEAIRHNGGQVPFELELQPPGLELAEGHRVEIVVDGSVKGSGRPPTVTAGTIDRGPHNASARVVDAGGNTLVQSQTVNFFLLRAAVGNNP
ncbi:MAG: DUF4124 domain-containing protein [Halofilum sp. (in: g-proteobacteria)]|nr:DUF4124 domain-containing protein [Halofilum sp. (in: g-proteobacteria)]